jgi:hypothetical protein
VPKNSIDSIAVSSLAKRLVCVILVGRMLIEYGVFPFFETQLVEGFAPWVNLSAIP